MTGRSVLPRPSPQKSRRLCLFLIASFVILAAARPSSAVEGVQQLQLEVFINGRSTGLIGSFHLSDARHLEARSEELGREPIN